MLSDDAIVRCATSHTTRLLAATRPLLEALRATGATPAALAALLAQAKRDQPEWLSLFETEREGDFCLRHALLYPPIDPDPLHELAFTSARSGSRITISEPDEEQCSDVATLLHACVSGANDAADVARAVDEPARELLEALLENGTLEGRPAREPRPLAVGVTRLQHAAVAIRSRTTTCLVDPHFHSGYASDPRFAMHPSDYVGRTDAVLVSHSHADHWDIPSLLMFPRETVFVVPRVPRASILSDNMAARLRALGFLHVIELDWHAAPARVGDVEIHALPFYGEQPTVRDLPRDPDVRNWGNTYYVRTPELSAWVLIDSGTDHAGSMSDVADTVRDRFGGVDAVLSNLRSFHVGTGQASPLYITLGAFWLSLDADQLRRFATMGDQRITLGTRGVADACARARARTFLPYAHWWAPEGAQGEQEPALLGELANDMAAVRSATRIRAWRIGESYAGESR